MTLQHLSTKSPAKCALCGTPEPTSGTYPMVVGVGRVCLSCGMKKVKCEACGNEVKLLTSSRLQGRTLCLADHMKEIEKFRKNVVVSFDEDQEPAASILARAYSEAPDGYTLLSVRRARNSTHVWEAEYEKTELFQMKCS
ncbi:MAG: hypothetical protein LYZ69_01230 [Nitrososphaerales archaeon]|nr:hypothetical protein [Nitrososphaerales archaeon]